MNDRSKPSLDPGEITGSLRARQGGSDEGQDELWQVLYEELRTIARSVLRRAGRDATHGATSLVHKAYLRLRLSEVEWTDRRHFFAVAARAMRFVLTDEARHHLAKKRGAGQTKPFESSSPKAAGPPAMSPEEVLSLHHALARLAEINPRYEEIAELRYFAGLSVEETAEVLNVTPRTVVRNWKMARVCLLDELRATA